MFNAKGGGKYHNWKERSSTTFGMERTEDVEWDDLLHAHTVRNAGGLENKTRKNLQRNRRNLVKRGMGRTIRDERTKESVIAGESSPSG